jgi:UDP-3-O-acyl-N-acetylglucosamine deacetylase
VARATSVRGVGLFTAARATLTIRPAERARAGLVFRRIDLPGRPLIPALVSHLAPDSRHTLLRLDPADPRSPEVHTTEHVLSALAGMGVTDAPLDLDGPEVPIADGSAAPFVEAVRQAGIAPLGATQGDGAFPGADSLPAEPIEVRDAAGATVTWHPPPPTPPPPASPTPATPPPGATTEECSLHLEYHLDYGPGSPIPRQTASLDIAWTPRGPRSAYAEQVAPARTFCLKAEARAFRAAGLFGHLGPADMLVIDDDGRPIENALRFPDEPARHKLLDLLGDLALVGVPLAGRVVARRSGHALNHALAAAIDRARATA